EGYAQAYVRPAGAFGKRDGAVTLSLLRQSALPLRHAPLLSGLRRAWRATAPLASLIRDRRHHRLSADAGGRDQARSSHRANDRGRSPIGRSRTEIPSCAAPLIAGDAQQSRAHFAARTTTHRE